MIPRGCFWAVIAVSLTAGCGEKRVHIRPELARIDRVAVVNLDEVRKGDPVPEGEYFTNEFVSVGFLVLERGRLQDVIRAAFTKSGYLDEHSVAEWGKGLGIKGVVLHQMRVEDRPSRDDRFRREYSVTGWIRIVDAEQGIIVLTYNADTAVSSGSRDQAARQYARQVVDDIKRALKERGIFPMAAPERHGPPSAGGG
jgi:hypothetical protein